MRSPIWLAFSTFSKHAAIMAWSISCSPRRAPFTARIGAVNGARRGEHEMLHAIMAACFENVEKANQIGLRIVPGMGDRMPHTGLSGEMDHTLRPVLGEQSVDRL